MLSTYIEAAMRHATYEWLEEDGIWYAEIPPLPGVWATAPRARNCQSSCGRSLRAGSRSDYA